MDIEYRYRLSLVFTQWIVLPAQKNYFYWSCGLVVCLALWGLPLMVEVKGWISSVITLAPGLISISTAVWFPPSAHTTPMDSITGKDWKSNKMLHTVIISTVQWGVCVCFLFFFYWEEGRVRSCMGTCLHLGHFLQSFWFHIWEDGKVHILKNPPEIVYF